MDLTEQQIQQMIENTLNKREIFNQYNVNPIPVHIHNGTDSPRIDAKDLVGGSSITGAQVIAALGYTPEDTANKDATTTLGTSNTKYPTQNAVKSYVDTGLSSKEAVANKSTNTSLGTSDTLYPSQNAVKTYVDSKSAALSITETFTAGTTLQWSNDAAKNFINYSNYTELKTITLNDDLPAVQLSFDCSLDAGCFVRFFKNGSFLDGTEYTISGTYTKNVTGLVTGDTISLYGKAGALGGSVSNFRLYFKREITKIQTRPLITPLAATFITNPTNTTV